MNKKLLPILIGALLASVPAARAQIQIITTEFTDSNVYTVSNTDLLQTSLSSAVVTGGYSGAFGGSTPVTRLYDGVFGAPRDDYNSIVGFNNGSQVTFNLDLAANARGYNITSFTTYVGWDNGRDGQEYSVSYSLASDPFTFFDLVSVPQLAAGDGSGYPTRRTSVTVQDGGANPYLLEGVAALRFTFTEFENGGSAFREFDVAGTASAIPEPSTYAAMAGFAALGLAIFRRTRQVRVNA